ncbi:hypothetical protein PR048_009832, partial [Dryococelus australis]
MVQNVPLVRNSPLNNKAYCFVCRAFYKPETKTKEDDAYTLSVFSKWKKAVSVFEKHQKGSSHMINNVKLASLKESDKSGTVAEKVSVQQSIALRGHDESTDSKNNGNFLELMELRSKDSNLIKQFYVEHQKNFQYTSATFQNELLSIIGEQIKLYIGNKVREAKMFAIIADETQYIAKHEEVAIVLRHVNENLEVHDSSVGFYRAEKTDGETLANLLKNDLVSLEWTCRVEGVRSFLDNFEATLSALQEISQTGPDSEGQANALLKSMEDFNFVFDLLLLRRVLTQKEAKFERKLAVGSKVPFETTQQFYKVTVLNPVIDILEQQIKAKLQENNLDVLNHKSSSKWKR